MLGTPGHRPDCLRAFPYPGDSRELCFDASTYKGTRPSPCTSRHAGILAQQWLRVAYEVTASPLLSSSIVLKGIGHWDSLFQGSMEANVLPFWEDSGQYMAPLGFSTLVWGG